MQRTKLQHRTPVALHRSYRKHEKEHHEKLSLFRLLMSIEICIISLLCVSNWVDAFSLFGLPQRWHHRAIASVLSESTYPTRPSKECRLSGSVLFALRSDDGNASPDEDEWMAMLAAFKMYKAAYGNLKVPLRFTVPALAPWPGQHFAT